MLRYKFGSVYHTRYKISAAVSGIINKTKTGSSKLSNVSSEHLQDIIESKIRKLWPIEAIHGNKICIVISWAIRTVSSNCMQPRHEYQFEPVHEKTNNFGSDQVRYRIVKPGCTVTEDG